MSKVTYLAAEVPLTKSFHIENGELVKVGHPRIYDCTSFTEEYETLDEFCEIMRRHAAQGHCLLKGNTTRPLKGESRMGSTDPNAPTDVLLLDLDGLKEIETTDAMLAELGFSECDHIVQYSASSGIVPGRGLSAHVFLLLEKPMAPPLLKQYLKHWNLTLEKLRKDLKLTRTANALRWPLDVSTCQNDKLIYVAPPVLGEGVEDGFKGERIQLVRRKHRRVRLGPAPNTEAVGKLEAKALNQLRQAAGLEEKKFKYKMHNGVPIQSNPDSSTVSGVKAARGYVYLNLNNGDSWGYFHPEGNPDVLYNFKGEPNYLLKDIAPDYWREAKREALAPKPDENGNIYLAFIDFRSSRYFYAIINGRKMELVQARGPDQLRSFCQQYGRPIPDLFPMYYLVYEPGADYILDVENRKINMYQPPDFALQPLKKVKEVPPMVRKVLLHALGDDEEAFEHFNNWLACIVQHHKRTNTAWIWHGVQGTGKGLMLDSILRPCLGRTNVVTRRIQDMEDKFNPALEHCQLLWLEESDTEAMKNPKLVDATFKSIITEPQITIRPMFAPAMEVMNHVSVIISSNKDEPMIVDVHDRRYNVGTHQSKRLDITPKEVSQLEAEAFEYYCYLRGRKADREVARHALNNPAKREMVYLNRTSLDVAIDNVLAGNHAFFAALKHENPGKIVGGFDAKALAENYNALVDALPENKNITRDELMLLLTYAVGNIPQQPAKFTAMLKHHRIKEFKTVRRGNVTHRGLNVEWKKCTESSPTAN